MLHPPFPPRPDLRRDVVEHLHAELLEFGPEPQIEPWIVHQKVRVRLEARDIVEDGATRTQDDRLDTLARVRDAGINVCCGGIVGMGETRKTRAALIAQLANLDPYPDSVPINNLVQVEGTPLHGTAELDLFEFVRTIAAARITMPKAMVRLSAGRQEMSEGIQALCFAAGANSIFYGDKLLTTGNPEAERDRGLLDKLGMHLMPLAAKPQ